MKAKIFLIAWFIFVILRANAQTNQSVSYRIKNIPSKTTSRTPIASGPTVLGVFDGRFPCAEILKDWKQPVPPECQKMKWSLTLYIDPQTQQPTTYSINRSRRAGKWAIIHGIKNDPLATVYQLDSDRPDESVYLFKGSDDVLFILDQERNFRVGDFYLSYTLNRVVN